MSTKLGPPKDGKQTVDNTKPAPRGSGMGAGMNSNSSQNHNPNTSSTAALAKAKGGKPPLHATGATALTPTPKELIR